MVVLNSGLCLQEQWNEVNKGRCGICGDPWSGLKENETPGIYATGTIVDTYNKDQLIPVHVFINTNLGGWFEFRLCENNDFEYDKDQACFDKYVILILKTSNSHLHITIIFFPFKATCLKPQMRLRDFLCHKAQEP